MRRGLFALLLMAAWLAGLAAAGPVADSVTLHPRATVLRSDEFSLGVAGRISSGAEGEYVVVKGKECGIPGAFFRGLGGATTLAGGGYEASVFVRTKTTLRAEWKGATSPTVVVTPRASITLTKEEDGFRVALSSSTSSVDGKKGGRPTAHAGRVEDAADDRPQGADGLRPVRGEEEAPLQGAEGNDDPRGAPALAGGRLLPGRIQQAHPNVEGGEVTEVGGNLGQAAEIAARLIANIETVVHGKTEEVRLVLAALVCDGHVLLEDVPGTAKTVLARAIAGSVEGASFARIQCTPDLQPTDVTGPLRLQPA